MRTFQLTVILVSLLLVTTTSLVEAKRKKHKSSDPSPSKTKTKTKWSTSTDLGAQSQNSMVATEEHGYYVKRTFLPRTADQNASSPRSPPFLAVPIAWFPCPNANCMKLNSLAINSNQNTLSQGFLCDDDCVTPYEPICGKTSAEVAVFYNKCKLNVAKCRTHGFWMDLSYEQCKMQYPAEVKYAELKFRANPYFKEKQQLEEIIAEESIILTENEKPEADATTMMPVEAASESLIMIKEINKHEPQETEKEAASESIIMIKEINEHEPQEKVKESKDHYKEIKKDSKESSEENTM